MGIGVEINRTYCELARKRLDKHAKIYHTREIRTAKAGKLNQAMINVAGSSLCVVFRVLFIGLKRGQIVAEHHPSVIYSSHNPHPF